MSSINPNRPGVGTGAGSQGVSGTSEGADVREGTGNRLSVSDSTAESRAGSISPRLSRVSSSSPLDNLSVSSENSRGRLSSGSSSASSGKKSTTAKVRSAALRAFSGVRKALSRPPSSESLESSSSSSSSKSGSSTSSDKIKAAAKRMKDAAKNVMGPLSKLAGKKKAKITKEDITILKLSQEKDDFHGEAAEQRHSSESSDVGKESAVASTSTTVKAGDEESNGESAAQVMNLTTALREEIKTAKQERSARASSGLTEQSAKGRQLEDRLENLESELLALIGNLEEQMATGSQGVIEPSSSRGGTQSQTNVNIEEDLNRLLAMMGKKLATEPQSTGSSSKLEGGAQTKTPPKADDPRTKTGANADSARLEKVESDLDELMASLQEQLTTEPKSTVASSKLEGGAQTKTPPKADDPRTKTGANADSTRRAKVESDLDKLMADLQKQLTAKPQSTVASSKLEGGTQTKTPPKADPRTKTGANADSARLTKVESDLDELMANLQEQLTAKPQSTESTAKSGQAQGNKTPPKVAPKPKFTPPGKASSGTGTAQPKKPQVPPKPKFTPPGKTSSGTGTAQPKKPQVPPKPPHLR